MYIRDRSVRAHRNRAWHSERVPDSAEHQEAVVGADLAHVSILNGLVQLAVVLQLVAAVLVAQHVVSEIDDGVAVGGLDQGPVALGTRRSWRRRRRRYADDADRDVGTQGGFRRWSGHGDDVSLGVRRPAVVRQPAPDHHGHQADQQRQHYVDLGVACAQTPTSSKFKFTARSKDEHAA